MKAIQRGYKRYFAPEISSFPPVSVWLWLHHSKHRSFFCRLWQDCQSFSFRYLGVRRGFRRQGLHSYIQGPQQRCLPSDLYTRRRKLLLANRYWGTGHQSRRRSDFRLGWFNCQILVFWYWRMFENFQRSLRGSHYHGYRCHWQNLVHCRCGRLDQIMEHQHGSSTEGKYPHCPSSS